ncbi:MAG: PilZ domain-containing protein [Elusimicrobia bacterium]|nr:PilZ domain-containing protein [Elusimicrobiota bacterium]
MTSEKRKHPRFQADFTMNIVTKAQGVKKCRGSITDISESGMTFNTDAELEEGQALYLKVDHPEIKAIRGEVRSIDDNVVGGMRRHGIQLHFVEYGSNARPEVIAARFQK